MSEQITLHSQPLYVTALELHPKAYNIVHAHDWLAMTMTNVTSSETPEDVIVITQS